MKFVEVRRVGIEAAALFDVPSEERAAIENCISRSDPALGFWWQGALHAVVGFIPTAIITDTAYCWLQVMPSIAEHKLLAGRQGKLVIVEIRKRYPRITGHCFEESSIRWLRSLGAEFGESNGKLLPFIIGG